MDKPSLIGQRFGRLTVLTVSPREHPEGGYLADCMCDCGNRSVAVVKNLKQGHTSSCGCLRREVARSRQLTHGLSHSRAYKSWNMMMHRCHNSKAPGYRNYGGRGISVCDSWRASFVSFRRDMGERPPGTSLDRIDNSLGYCPENCRWATPSQQRRNTRRNVWVVIAGEARAVTDWARDPRCSVSPLAFYRRIRRGMDPILAFTAPSTRSASAEIVA
jgi:hypothetical protein